MNAAPIFPSNPRELSILVEEAIKEKRIPRSKANVILGAFNEASTKEYSRVSADQLHEAYEAIKSAMTEPPEVKQPEEVEQPPVVVSLDEHQAKRRKAALVEVDRLKLFRIKNPAPIAALETCFTTALTYLDEYNSEHRKNLKACEQVGAAEQVRDEAQRKRDGAAVAVGRALTEAKAIFNAYRQACKEARIGKLTTDPWAIIDPDGSLQGSNWLHHDTTWADVLKHHFGKAVSSAYEAMAQAKRAARVGVAAASAERREGNNDRKRRSRAKDSVTSPPVTESTEAGDEHAASEPTAEPQEQQEPEEPHEPAREPEHAPAAAPEPVTAAPKPATFDVNAETRITKAVHKCRLVLTLISFQERLEVMRRLDLERVEWEQALAQAAE